MERTAKIVGSPVMKKDAMALVTGKPVYTDDIAPKDCLVVKVLRSPHAHALIKEIDKEAAEKISASVHMCFIPDTLKFLRAGGRVSNGAAIAGELLKLHPQIEILDGYLQATKKHRGKMKKIAVKVIPE